MGCSNSSNKTIIHFIAIFDYEESCPADITIKKNDKLKVLDKRRGSFWLVKNMRTKKIGYVPYNYITREDDLQLKEWYFPNTTRRESERLLEYLENEPGVFMIRESESDKENCRALSVFDLDKNGQRSTKHFLIRHTESGSFYISPRKRFESLDELIAYYSRYNSEKVPKLTKPCKKLPTFNGYDVWEEERKNIKLDRIIGSGNFGEVYRGLWRKKFEVAVKTIKFSENDMQNFQKLEARKEEFRKELEIMKKLRHEKLVKLWCVCTIGEPVFIVTEYMSNGCLLNYLRKGKGKNLTFKEAIDMCAQIACGMKYLEASRCVHRDLAARNILVGESNIVKISDFGFAKILNNSGNLDLNPEETNTFPVKWTAPEVFDIDPITGLRVYTSKSDVWSYGILLYEIITLGANPYPGMTHQKIIALVKFNDYRMPKPYGLCTDDFYSLMLKCWDKDPQQRPTFEWLYHYLNDYFVSVQPSYQPEV